MKTSWQNYGKTHFLKEKNTKKSYGKHCLLYMHQNESGSGKQLT